jgi:short-subunit dehydrogenase
MELNGKVVVITGASRGIGRALSLALARSGCTLLLTALEGDELASVSKYLTADLGVSVASMPADLTRESDRRRLLEWIGSGHRPPDILINNAGAGRFGRFASCDLRDVEYMIDLNIRAPLLLSRELIPALRKRPEAKIVNISSGVARLPYPGLAVYGATKGFLSSLSESLACELAETNISVLCFHPGFTATQFMESAGMDIGDIPKFMISSPETVAARIVRAIEKDVQWTYSDISSRYGGMLARFLPSRLRTSLFRNLFWRLPHDE